MNCLSKTIFLCVATLCGLSCTSRVNDAFLGSAVAETRTCLVATVAQGTILTMYKDEGQKVTKGELMAVIDTVQLTLMRQEIIASAGELGASIAAQEAQSQAIASEVAGAEREFTRIEGLVKKGSAPEQQRDNLGTQLQTAQLRLSASRRTVSSLLEKNKGLKIKLAEIDNRIAHCFVKSPLKGIVLTRYRSPGEVIAAGNPLFEVGDFDTLYADFFVPQPLLSSLTYGQKVRIRCDTQEPKKDGELFIPALITWIASDAEFSPKNIQTRESRNELVFRIRATIPNVQGVIKRGLPVEVWR